MFRKAALAVALAASAFAATAVQAHPQLASTTPAANAIVVATTRLQLVLSEALVATLARPLPSGTYKIDYHAVSTDTHRIQGSYTFKVR